MTIGKLADPNGLTQLSDSFAPTAITKDGSPVGNLMGVEVDENGYIMASYDTGFIRRIYQIPLVDVPNVNGLTALDKDAVVSAEFFRSGAISWSEVHVEISTPRIGHGLCRGRALRRAGASGLAVSFVTPASEAHWRLIEKRQGLSLPLEVLPGFEPKEEVPPASPGNGGIKGKRPSKKDKLRAAAAAAARKPD